MGVSQGLITLLQANAQTGRGYATFDLKDAWVGADCPHCGGVQALKVGSAADVVWLRCATCEQGFVKNGAKTAPSRLPMRVPDNVPPADREVWQEVRECLGSGAYMAAALLCRKLLMHIAVEKKLPAKDGRGFAPTFEECVKHLRKVGTITEPMVEWVKVIKDVGNEATHEIKPVTEQQATQVATFTQMLLSLAYEMRLTPAVETGDTPGASSADHVPEA